MDRRRLGVAGALLGLLILCGLWIALEPEPGPVAPPVAAADDAPDPAAAAPRPEVAPVPLPPDARYDDPYVAVAEAMDLDWIRCPAAGLPAGFQILGVHQAEVRDGVFSAFVPAAEGGVSVTLPFEEPSCEGIEDYDELGDCLQDKLEQLMASRVPVATLVWWGASGPEPGSCVVQDPRMIEVDVQIVGAEVGALRDQWSGARYEVTTGRVTVVLPADTTSDLLFTSFEGSGRLRARVSEAGTTLQLPVRGRERTEDVGAALEAQMRARVDQARSNLDRPALLDTVLEWPDLDPEARARVEQWQVEERERRQVQLADAEARLDEELERQARNAARHEEAEALREQVVKQLEAAGVEEVELIR